MNEVKKVSYILLGVIIGILLTASVGAYAASTGLIGKKIAAEMPVYVDGDKIPDVAIVVDGKSYLPVRKTADIAGLGLDLKNKSIYLTGNEVVPVNQNTRTIEDIDSQIGIYKQLLWSAKDGLAGATTPEGIEGSTKQVADLEAKLKELEQEKAALEATK
ncbi:hypothetical protein KQR54_18715 [Mycobacterium gordonae]|nr:hypothetical protein [Mycobacterium gordonae]